MRASLPPPPGCQLRDVLKEGGQESQNCELTRKGSANNKALTETGCPQREQILRKPGFSWGREHSQEWVISASARTHAKRVQRKDKAEANLPTGAVCLLGRLRLRPPSVQGLTKPLGVGRQT
jgi:hypothetical protein